MQTATDALMAQLADMHALVERLTTAIDDITGTINPDDATWPDVARYAHLADRARNALAD